MATRRSEAAREARRKVGSFPSRDVDVLTALRLFEWSRYRFARSTEALPARSIRPILQALEEARPADPLVRFLRVAFDEQAPEASWREAVNALKQLESDLSWGSSARRAQMAAMAKHPRLLTAFQAATVAAPRVPTTFLAVLALDGSETSLDAVLPHFDRAMKDPLQLEALTQLEPFATGQPRLQPMMDHVRAQKSRATQASAVLQLARAQGWVKGDQRFRVQVRMDGTPRANVWCDLQLDSQSPVDFTVWLSTGVGGNASMVHFGTQGLIRDDLGLGACGVRELPAWLLTAQRELTLKWNRATARTSFLRGQRLSEFLSWLFSDDRRGDGGAPPTAPAR